MAKRIVLRRKPHNPSINHGPVVPQAQIVGPFPATSTPSRVGPFKRASPETGKLMWSYWNGTTWGMMGKNFDRALQRKAKASKFQTLPWYGIAAK